MTPSDPRKAVVQTAMQTGFKPGADPVQTPLTHTPYNPRGSEGGFCSAPTAPGQAFAQRISHGNRHYRDLAAGDAHRVFLIENPTLRRAR